MGVFYRWPTRAVWAGRVRGWDANSRTGRADRLGLDSPGQESWWWGRVFSGRQPVPAHECLPQRPAPSPAPAATTISSHQAEAHTAQTHASVRWIPFSSSSSHTTPTTTNTTTFCCCSCMQQHILQPPQFCNEPLWPEGREATWASELPRLLLQLPWARP